MAILFSGSSALEIVKTAIYKSKNYLTNTSIGRQMEESCQTGSEGKGIELTNQLR